MPPPPPPPYGAPPAAAGGYSPVTAIQYGWAKFTQNPSSLLVPVIVLVLGLIVIDAIVQIVLGAVFLGTHDCTRTVFGTQVDTQCGPGFFVRQMAYGLLSLVVSFLGQLVAAALIKGGLGTTDGKPFTIGSLFEGWDKAQVLIAAILIGIATFIGTVLCFVPGLIVAYLTSYTMFFIVDKHMAAVDAIKASIAFTTAHLGETILFFLLAFATALVGLILCIVGVFVAIPVVLVGAAYTFRVLNNEPVTPAA
jgi:uncharacterized membrane protein